MAKEIIKLNEDISIDIPRLIEGGMVILANSGGGKSYAIRRIAEQAVKHVQVIILDPEGEFSSLREKYDFILAGKDADVPVEVRSAAMLATKLLELNKSAVIDLYELHPQERQRYVKLFCDALVNAPKNLYHPVIIILDEAHEYVPEGKPSEATWAVESLASKGRKRGQRLILASQRIAKISKNVTAECNNKLIGRASQDIDMKRAGDELGFTKDKLSQLRQLKPGEFFVFGNAISDEVQKIKIGQVQTAHAKVGYKGGLKTPPPSDVIKKVLGELKDLPAEAEKEAKTTAELKKENTDLKRMNTNLLKNPFQKDLTKEDIAKIVAPYLKAKDEQLFKWQTEWQNQIQNWFKIIISIGESMKEFQKENPIKEKAWFLKNPPPLKKFNPLPPPPKESYMYAQPFRPLPITQNVEFSPDSLGKGELSVLTCLGQYPDGLEREHITVITGYKRSSRDAYIYRLTTKGLIESVNGKIIITQSGIKELGSNFKPLPVGGELRDYLMSTLPAGEKKVLSCLIDAHPESVTRETLTELTGYQRSSRDAYLYRLSNRQLVSFEGKGLVRASDKLFE